MGLNTMQVTSSNAASSLAGATDSSSSIVPQKVLNQDDFLKLLIAQMTAQDPLKPISNTDFVAQMAQFTSLEQSRTMSTNISQMLSQQQLLQANGLIGRDVSLQVDDTTFASGTVSAVQIEGGNPKIIVNGVSYDLNQVITIQPTKAS
jgi:flagellar basal-body rod modification protein FlgD